MTCECRSECIFTKKTLEELNNLTLARINGYYKAEYRRYGICKRDYEFRSLSDVRDEVKFESQLKEWYKYLMFVKALMKIKDGGSK